MTGTESAGPRPGRTAAVLLGAAALVTGLTGCSPDQDGNRDGNQTRITVRNVAFAPEDVTVPAGTDVGWYYEDGGTFHDILIEELGVDAGFRREGDWHYTFDIPGTYRVTCSIHLTMTGTVTVT